MFVMKKNELLKSTDPLFVFAGDVVEELKKLRADPKIGAPYVYDLEYINHAQNLLMGFETPDANGTLEARPRQSQYADPELIHEQEVSITGGAGPHWGQHLLHLSNGTVVFLHTGGHEGSRSGQSRTNP